MTFEDAIKHLDDRARFACDKLGNGKSLNWSGQDVNAWRAVRRGLGSGETGAQPVDGSTVAHGGRHPVPTGSPQSLGDDLLALVELEAGYGAVA